MKTKIENTLHAELQEEKEDFAEYEMLKSIMKKYEGKKITMRIQNDLPPGFKLQRGFNGFEIKSPRTYQSGGQAINKRHFLCYYEKQNEFTLAEFDRANAPYSQGAPERIEKLTAIINNPDKLHECVRVFEGLYKAMEQIKNLLKDMDAKGNDSFYNPAYHAILKAMGIDSRILSDIKY